MGYYRGYSTTARPVTLYGLKDMIFQSLPKSAQIKPKLETEILDFVPNFGINRNLVLFTIIDPCYIISTPNSLKNHLHNILSRLHKQLTRLLP